MIVATEIDSLQLKIGADAQKAYNAIDKLINKLGVLSKSLGGVDTKGLQKLATPERKASVLLCCRYRL